MLMFSQELIQRGEICHTNIMVCGLILKMRSGYTYSKMVYFIAFSFGYSSYQSRPRGRQAFSLSLKTINKRFRKMIIFVCWLTSKYTLLFLTKFSWCTWQIKSQHLQAPRKIRFFYIYHVVNCQSMWTTYFVECKIANYNMSERARQAPTYS